MPQDHQLEGLHMSTRITYILRWKWKGGRAQTRSSARETIYINQNNLQTETKKMPQGHQQEGWDMSTSITSLTPYKQANATRLSGRRPAHVNQHHLLSTSRKMSQGHQQESLPMSSRMTYILRANKCHNTISKMACTCQPEWLTYWEQANATGPSARGPAYVNQHHLLPTSREIPQGHQKRSAHVNQHYLLSKTHMAIRRGPAHVNQHHLLSKRRQIPQGHQKRAHVCQPASLTF